MATTACSALATLLLLSCNPGGSGGDAGTDPAAACTTRLVPALGNVIIDGSSGTSSPTVSFTVDIQNPTAARARLLGYVLECRYRSPDTSMLRGSGTTDAIVDPGGTWTLEVPSCVPGVVSWSGSPTGDDLTCTVEILYGYDGCDGNPPRTTDSVGGSEYITLVYP